MKPHRHLMKPVEGTTAYRCECGEEMTLEEAKGKLRQDYIKRGKEIPDNLKEPTP